jgi:hypothetical protein
MRQLHVINAQKRQERQEDEEERRILHGVNEESYNTYTG